MTAQAMKFLATLLACVAAAAAQSNNTAYVSVWNNVSVAVDVDATVRVVAEALERGGPALATARADVQAVDDQIQQLVDSQRAQNSSCISAELLEHVENEARFAVRLSQNSTWASLERLTLELEHLQGDMREARQQGQGDAACQPLEAQLVSLEANITAALRAVFYVLRIADHASQTAVLNVTITVSELVEIMNRNCLKTVEEAEHILRKLRRGHARYTPVVAEALRNAAEAAIAASNDGIEQVQALLTRWEASRNELQLQIKSRVVENFDASQNTDITQTATEIVTSSQSLIAALSLDLSVFYYFTLRLSNIQ